MIDLDTLRISLSNQFGDEDGFINKDYGRLVTKAHFQRLKDLLDDSINSVRQSLWVEKPTVLYSNGLDGC